MELSGLADTDGARLIGRRVESLRRGRGLSQATLAAPELSDSYISLIESGKRRPTPQVLELLAAKLGSSVGYLVAGVSDEELRDLHLRMRDARRAFDAGEVAEARDRFAGLAADHTLAEIPRLHQEALYGHALGLEACGDHEGAIDVLTRLRDENLAPHLRIPVLLAFCRACTGGGRPRAAVDAGEAVLFAAEPPPWSEDVVELGATLLGAYVAGGDLLRSQQYAAELMRAAERIGDEHALVAVRWNTAVMLDCLGRYDEALALAERALAAHLGDDAPRSVIRMQMACAVMLLRSRPGEAERARELLLNCRRVLDDVPSGPLDRGWAVVCLAQAELALRHPGKALRHLERFDELPDEVPGELRARGHLARARALVMLGRPGEADKEMYLGCAALEHSSSRFTTENWCAAAELYHDLGDDAHADEAYQRALGQVGL